MNSCISHGSSIKEDLQFYRKDKDFLINKLWSLPTPELAF